MFLHFWIKINHFCPFCPFFAHFCPFLSKFFFSKKCKFRPFNPFRAKIIRLILKKSSVIFPLLGILAAGNCIVSNSKSYIHTIVFSTLRILTSLFSTLRILTSHFPTVTTAVGSQIDPSRQRENGILKTPKSFPI